MARQEFKAEVRKCLKKAFDVVLEEIDDILEEELNKEPRIWVKDWLSRRDTLGASSLLLSELAVEDVKEYRSLLRMTPDMFEALLDMISPQVSKQDTVMRDAIPPKIKLEVTLNFLATGNSFRSLQHLFRVSRSAITNFVPEVCEAITNVLSEFIKIPQTHQDWKVMANGFNELWNFPNCCGALDGKHVLIEAPPNSGSEYFNYKGTHSLVLMAIVDHDYCFSYFEVGHKGSESDGGVFQNSPLRVRLEEGMLPDGSFFIADDAFPLKPYLMKPYSRQLAADERIFNYRLSRARRIVENGFGILVSRFRAFDGKLQCKVTTVPKLVSAACSLHNWMRKTSPDLYLPRGSVDEEDSDSGKVIPGRWRPEIRQLRNLEKFGGRQTTKLAKNMRNKLKAFVNNEGAVPWQYQCV